MEKRYLRRVRTDEEGAGWARICKIFATKDKLCGATQEPKELRENGKRIPYNQRGMQLSSGAI